MPNTYRSGIPVIPEPEDLKSKDLGVNLDIGGPTVVKELTAAEKMSKMYGNPYEETSGRGVNVETKIPIVSDVIKGIGDSPIGWGVGRIFDVLNLPSAVVQNIYANLRVRMFEQDDLPSDVKNMLSAGKPIDEIADYLVRTNRSFTNDNMQNLLFTLLLDPLNYTPLAFSKVGALKPLTTVASGIAGGAAGGALVAGPVGMIGGAAAGAFAGWKGAKALKNAAEVAAKTEDMSAANKIVQFLDKPRGLNITERLRTGATMESNILEQTKSIEDLQSKLTQIGIGGAAMGGEAAQIKRDIEKAQTAIKSFEAAKEVGNSINNSVAIGMYRGLVGSKNAATAGLGKFAGAMMVPAQQLVPMVWGRRGNEVMDRVSSLFGEKSNSVLEQFGQGMANYTLIGMGKSLIGPEVSQAKVYAENTANLYYRAKDELAKAGALEGATPGQQNDNIVGKMLELAKNEPGGAASVLDATDPVEISRRVKILMNVSDIERAAQGTGSLAAVQRLESSIADGYVGAKLERMYKAGGVEKALLDHVRELGPRRVSQKGVEEAERGILETIHEVRNKQAAKTAFLGHMQNIAESNGKSWGGGLEQAAIAEFESLFGKYYDQAGNIMSTGTLKNVSRGMFGNSFATETVNAAARDMSLIRTGSFASSNGTAIKINQGIENLSKMASSVDPVVVAKRNEIVAKLGQETFDQLVKQADALGKVTVVKSGYMFHESVVAARSVIGIIDRAVEEGKAAQGGRLNIEAKVELGKPLISDYIGGADDILAINIRIKKLMSEARMAKNSDEYVVLRKLSREIGESKNLAEARKAWANVVTDHFDDLRTQFGPNTVPENLSSFLDTVIENRQTLHALTGKQTSQLKKISEAFGIDPKVIDKMSELSYTVVKAPTRGVMRSQRVVEQAGSAKDATKFTVESRLTPFIDLTSSTLSDVAYVPRYSANRLQELMTIVFSPMGNAALANSVKQRLAGYLARGGATTGHVERVVDELVRESMRLGVGARGLDREVVEAAFKRAFDMADSNGGYERFAEFWQANTLKGTQKFDPISAVMYAFQGDLTKVGATQYLSGGLKRWMPAMTEITDKLYPSIRFKNNPMFWVQEYIESPFLNAARGVDKSRLTAHTKKGQLLDITSGEVRDLAKVGPELHTIVDNINFVQTFRTDALRRSMTGDWSVTELFKEGFFKRSGEYLKNMKESYKDDLAMDIAARNFGDNLQKRDPYLWASLVEHYGTTDSRALFVNFANERRKLSNYDRVLSSIEANRPARFGFMSLPDKKFTTMSEETTRVFGSLTGTNVGVVDGHLTNPQRLIDDITLTKANMADAGYDMGTVGKELDALEAEARIMADYLRRNTNKNVITSIDPDTSGMYARYADSVKRTRKAFNVLLKDRMKSNYRYVAAQQVLLQAGFREGAGLSYEGDRIAQALALGHSYGAEIGDVASTLQRMVDDVASEFPDAYVIREVFDETANVARPVAMEMKTVETVDDLVKASYVGESALPREIVDMLRAKVLEQTKLDPQLVNAFDDAAVRLITNHGSEERVYRAFQESYSVALKQAQITTYANMERSFFERSINHPFLGIYPYSYMFKKILPEMVEFLFKRPFGTMAPGAGYQAYAHVRDYVEHQVETDLAFRNTLKNNDQVAFLVSQLFPGLPWDIAAVPSAIVRNITLSTVGGRDKDYNLLTDLLGRDVVTKGSRFGLPSAATSFIGASDQLITELSGGNKPAPSVAPGYRGMPDWKEYGG